MCWFVDQYFNIFISFSGGSEPRSARVGAIQTQFFIFEAASEQTQFLLDFYFHLRVISGINAEFDNKNVKIRP